jgi:hypothetical protein
MSIAGSRPFEGEYHGQEGWLACEIAPVKGVEFKSKLPTFYACKATQLVEICTLLLHFAAKLGRTEYGHFA